MMQADHELLAGVRRLRRELVTIGREGERSDGDFDRVSLPGDDADVLRDVLLAEHARVVIEVGLAYGASALAIAEALVTEGTQGAEHLIIDAFQDHFHVVADGLVADAAFVDGSHRFDNVFVDLFFLRDLVSPGGLVVLDDCQWRSVATAVRYFEVNAGWRPEPLDRPTRLRAYRLPNPRTDPRFEDFESFGVDGSN